MKASVDDLYEHAQCLLVWGSQALNINWENGYNIFTPL